MVQLPAGAVLDPSVRGHLSRLPGCDHWTRRAGPEQTPPLVGVCRSGVAVRITGEVAAR